MVGARLAGDWLLFGRAAWLAIFLLTLVVLCANLALGGYDAVTNVLLVANATVWFAVGLVLFWRKSTDRAILLISLQLVLTTGFFIPHYPGALVNDAVWWVPIDVLGLLAGTSLIAVYTFPDGRFVPGFTRWLSVGWLAASLLPIPTFGSFDPWNYWLSPVYAWVRIAFYGSLALALLYRYRWMSTPVQRQKIKWVVFAGAIVVAEANLASLLAFVLPDTFPAPGPSAQFHQVIHSLTQIVPALFPLAIGIALFRYRLWDIDIVIRRTLVYASLTMLLALVYFALVIGLQSLVHLVTGTISDQPIISVASTLAIAALFQPLQGRIQTLIDRSFYRRRYDAARTLETFSARLRDEVDLDSLQIELLAAVQRAMLPASAALWLRPPRRDRP